MSSTPTASASGGRYQSKSGEDLIQFLNRNGKVVVWVDCDGTLWISTTASGEAVQQMGLPSED